MRVIKTKCKNQHTLGATLPWHQRDSSTIKQNLTWIVRQSLTALWWRFDGDVQPDESSYHDRGRRRGCAILSSNFTSLSQARGLMMLRIWLRNYKSSRKKSISSTWILNSSKPPWIPSSILEKQQLLTCTPNLHWALCVTYIGFIYLFVRWTLNMLTPNALCGVRIWFGIRSRGCFGVRKLV